MNLLPRVVTLSRSVFCCSVPTQLAVETTASVPVAFAASQRPVMISKCHNVLRTTHLNRTTHVAAALPRRNMSSSVVPPSQGPYQTIAGGPSPSSSTTDTPSRADNLKTAAFGPDAAAGFTQSGDPNAGMGVPAFAGGPVAAPAGADFAEEEAAPLRFKGTQPVRRGRTAVPGLATTCWGTDALKQQYPQLREDTEADVAVVGGGISGLTTAYLLAKAGEVWSRF